MRTHLKFGIGIGLISALWLHLEFIFGLHTKYHDLFLIVTNFVFLIPLIGIPLGIKATRKGQEGWSYKKAVMAGLIMTAIYAVIVGINQYFYHVVIHPAYFDLMLERAAVMAEEANDPQILVFAKQQFTTANYVFQVFISAAVFGGLVSLIAAAFLKKS